MVGGCVRDKLMGIDSKDIDFAVECESFDVMRAELVAQGFEIFTENPEFFVIRAHFPKTHEQFGKTTADFVLCRRDGFSTDSRRPDQVFAGTLLDDLARRDFTMNAIAQGLDGELIDPHGGEHDIEWGIIRFVCDPHTRLQEDGLRAIRGLRFMVTKNFHMHADSWDAINATSTIRFLNAVSTERIRDELHKMFWHDTIKSFDLLNTINPNLLEAILRPGIKLLPSMKGN